MPLNDLTPELRTRLSRVEKSVGWFVTLATLILIGGFAYYIYATAQDRGWFVTKINYATGLNDSTGLKIGDPVKLLGFNIGEVTRVDLAKPDEGRGVTVYFTIRDPYYLYIWYDSHVKLVSDFLGNRYLEVQKGKIGGPTVITNQSGTPFVMRRYLAWHKYQAITNDLAQAPETKSLSLDDRLSKATNDIIALLKSETNTYYTNVAEGHFDKPVITSADIPIDKRNYCWIPALDEPDLSTRLTGVAVMLEKAMPNILGFTNQLASVLSNANIAVKRLDTTIAAVDPILTNVSTITANLRNPNGSLGNWIIPTNLSPQLHATLKAATAALSSAHTTLDSTDTNLTLIATDLDKTLDHLADLTGSLSAQVQANTNLISDINTAIVHTDGLVQGLKHHWLLRSAFKKKPEKKDKSEPPAQAAHQR